MNIIHQKSFEKRECPSCACLVLKNNNRCPICNYEFPNEMPMKRNVRIWGAILMILLFAMMILGFSL